MQVNPFYSVTFRKYISKWGETMKKLILIGMLTISSAAMAHGDFHRGYVYGRPPMHHHHHQGWAWALPTLAAGAIVYKALEPAPQVYVQPSYPQPVFTHCGPWTEVINPDGTLTRTRTCY